MFVIIISRKVHEHEEKMSNLLNLDLDNDSAVVLASPYQNINDRKEIYLKYLIISALKAKTDIVDIQESLFYSKKFYSLTRLFDFYVNNNVFDLIILKPDENEVLFDVVQDEIHSNIYGYAVARVSADFKTAEILGYFLSKDFRKVVLGKKINVSALTAVDDFENIEILDSQMTLEDVSDRFFELLSGFMDDDLDEDSLSELACLLYNSCELRETFAEIGRFESLCENMKNNAELLDDNFLSVIGGEMPVDEDVVSQNIEDITSQDDVTDTEELVLDDLTPLVEDEPLVIDTEDIDLLSDVADEPVEAIEEVSEHETTEFVSDSEELSAELEGKVDELELEDIANAEEVLDIAEVSDVADDDEVETLSVDEEGEFSLELDEISSEDEVEPVHNEVILDDIVGDFQTSEILTDEEESLSNESEKLNDNVDDISLESLDIDGDVDDLVELQNDDEDLSLLGNASENNEVVVKEEKLSFASLKLEGDDDIDLSLDSKLEEVESVELGTDSSLDLSLDSDIPVIDEKVETPVNANENRLAAELASLSLQTEEETEVVEAESAFEIVEELPKITEVEAVVDEDLQIIETLAEPFVAEEAPREVVRSDSDDDIATSEVLSDELLELLSDDNVQEVSVDDNELYSILGVEQEATEVEQVEEKELELTFEQDIQSVNNESPVEEENVDIASLLPKEEESSEVETPKADISLLYTPGGSDSSNIADEEDVMPIGYKNIDKKQGNNRKPVVIVAVLALLVVVALGTNMNFSKGAKVSYDAPKEKEVVKKKEVSRVEPPVAKKPAVIDDVDDEVYAPKVASSSKETKIETSLSNQAGAAPVILKSVAWQVPTSISKDVVFNKYLQIAGKNIKLNLSSDLLETDDFAYNNKIKISMTVKNNMPVKNIKVVESSGSKNVDDIVLQSIKQTLKYINTPVMSEDRGDREVILVISI